MNNAPTPTWKVQRMIEMAATHTAAEIGKEVRSRPDLVRRKLSEAGLFPLRQCRICEEKKPESEFGGPFARQCLDCFSAQGAKYIPMEEKLEREAARGARKLAKLWPASEGIATRYIQHEVRV